MSADGRSLAERGRDLLYHNGYHLAWTTRWPHGALELYVGPRGVRLLQTFDDDRGVEVFAPADGNDWAGFEALIAPKEGDPT